MNELLNIFPLHTSSPRTEVTAHFSVYSTGEGDVGLDSAHVYSPDERPYIECANLKPADAFELGSRLIEEAYKAEGRECVEIYAALKPELPPIAEALYRQAVRQLGEF